VTRAIYGTEPISDLYGSASAICVQLGDELRDEDNHHQHRSGDSFAAEHRDESRHGHENLGADFALVHEVAQAGFDERIQPDGDSDP